MGVVGVALNALDVRLLTDVEGESFGKGSAIGNSAVGADTAIGEGVLILSLIFAARAIDWT